MTSAAALTETITEFSFGRSMLNILPKSTTKCFWDCLSSAEKLECIRRDRPVNIGGQTAWVAQGIVQKTWQDLVFPSIQKILEEQEAKIFEPCNGLILAFDVNIYMCGSLESFRPTVVASCMEIKVAKMILKFTKAHLKSNRLGFGFLAVRALLALTTGNPSDMGPFSLTQNACGVPISIRYDAGGSHKIKAATIGGCLHVGSKHYGLTAAHMLFADSTNDAELPPSVKDAPLETCEVCSDISDLDVSEDGHSMSLRSSASQTLEESGQEYFWRSDSPQFQLTEYGPLLWDLVTQAPELENHELDWLLIPLEAENQHFENRVQFEGKDIYLHGVTDEAPDDTVILVAGQSGSQLLKASSTLGGIFIPSARRLLRTWSIFHEENTIIHGDSGSWAINESGGVYGYLVGTNEGSRVSYVAPMVTTIAAICGQNPGAEVRFPIRSTLVESERRTMTVRETERRIQLSGSFHAANAPRVSIGRAAKAASVRPWLDEVQAQSGDQALIDQLRDFPDLGDGLSGDEDALSDNDIPLGSEKGEGMSSATSSMIFSVGNQSRRADNDLAFASPEEDIESYPANLDRVLSFVPDIRGADGDREKSDPRYYKRPDAERFFVAGRVFAFLSHETVEGGKPGTDLSTVTYIMGAKDGKRVLSQIRRLVVIQERDGYCIAIPIDTYNGMGLLKDDLSDAERGAHAVVYGSDTKPIVLEKERAMTVKEPIAITLSGAEQKLDEFSRLNFGKALTVQWDVKVMNIGKVAAKSMPAFTRYSSSTLEFRRNVPQRATVDFFETPSRRGSPHEPTMLRRLGKTFMYDSKQGARERIARGVL
jgi:hypothetical protein